MRTRALQDQLQNLPLSYLSRGSAHACHRDVCVEFSGDHDVSASAWKDACPFQISDNTERRMHIWRRKINERKQKSKRSESVTRATILVECVGCRCET